MTMKTKWGFFALFLSLAVILMVVSSTDVVTLFSGSHQIVNITASGNDIDCLLCHQWVRNELDNASIHSSMDCEDCHRYEGTGIDFAKHTQVGNEAHAAYTPRCLDCHGAGGAAPQATAFNESDYGTDYSAHKEFVQDALNCSLSVGENEACLACHTNYSITIEYSYFWDIDYDLDSWDVPFTSFTPNGTREYPNTFKKSGAKHEFINTTDINCISCHKNIYDALVNGTPKTSEDYLTHAPIEIYTSGAGKEWDTDNPWGHYRYHYIPSANRATGVNNSYCFECHNVKKYADENPSNPYNLPNVTLDTNSTGVHAAEALWCQTCHGSGKTKVVINNPDYDMMGADGHTGLTFVDDIANNYARTFNGDICMGCHEAAMHGPPQCSRCHGSGNANVYIESEPSGYATNN